MKKFLALLLLFAFAITALAYPNVPAGVVTQTVLVRPNSGAENIAPALIVRTRFGLSRNMIVYGRRPRYPAAALQGGEGGLGKYAIDFSDFDGTVFDVRVLRSAGSYVLDSAVVNTMMEWRVRPRSIYKAIVVVEFLPGRFR